MEHIARLEESPRGVYCGAIGYVGPGNEATFSVAIRTLLLDRQTGTVSMGVGSGITWDADPSTEYTECLTKGKFLTSPPPPGLIESLRLENGCYPRLERHLARMAWGAGRLGQPFVAADARALLLAHAAMVVGTRKVRLLLSPAGELSVESQPLPATDDRPLLVAIASDVVDANDPLLYLKTDQRQRFDRARQEHPAADEVLFCNQQGELTEGTYHSLVLRLDGRLVTPPLTAGL
jgi:para-aminobenzoate synthetase/4-amino-4-deoxychorismate lyase